MENIGNYVRILHWQKVLQRICMILGVALVTICPAQVQISLDRVTAKYEVGETANFLISSSTSGQVTYRLQYDRFSDDISVGSLNLSAGVPQSLPFSLNEPGVVHCTVDQGGQSVKATAVFDPFNIAPLETEPADFDAFWATAKAELATIPHDPELAFHYSSSYSTTYRINLATVQGRRVYGYISVPIGQGPFPAVLSLPSFGSAANITKPQEYLAERGGALSMVISIHNVDPTQEDPNAYLPNDITDPHKMYFKMAVQASLRAVDYIFSRSDFDGQSLAVNGVSQGGGLAMMLAGIDERVKLLVQSNSTHCEHVGLRHNRASGFPYYIRKSRTEVGTQQHEEATAQAIKYFEGIYFSKRFKGPSLSVISYNDEICPPATTLSAYNQLQDMKILLHARDLDHNHPNEYWDGRLDFYRYYFPAMRTPPWPWPGTTTGYFANAGVDQTINLGDGLQLTGMIKKDGVVLNSLPVRWEKVSGPGSVSFTNSADYQTGASFSKEGTYVLRFSADDFDKLNTEAKYYTVADHVTIVVEDDSSGDVTPPTIQLSTGQTTVSGPFEVELLFSEPVVGFSLGDDISVSNGSASGLSGSGQNFSFTVTPSLAGLVSVELPANRLQDLAGNPNTASNLLIVNYEIVDNTPPSISLTTAANVVNGPFTVNLQFSEPVVGFSLGDDISVSNGSASGLSGSGQNFSFTVTPSLAGLVSVELPANRLQDLAGNPNTASNLLIVNYEIVDNTPPSISLTTAANVVNGPFTVNLQFSEPVVGFSLGDDISVSNGSASGLSGSGQNFSFTVTPSLAGLVSVELPANRLQDLAGNPNTASNLVEVDYQLIDQTPPGITLGTATNLVDGPFEISITFSEAVQGFGLDDLFVTNGAASNLSGSGLNMTASIAPMVAGPVSVEIVAGRIQDLAGNANLASNLLSVDFIPPDTERPSIVLTTATLEVEQAFIVNIQLSEVLEELRKEDFNINNGEAQMLSGSGLVFELLVQPFDDGEVSIVLLEGQVLDLAGNTNLASNELIVQYERKETEILRLFTSLSNRQVLLEWATNLDTQTEYYEIERSADGSNYFLLGTEVSKGDPGSVVAYQWVDTLPLMGSNYYRVKQYHKNGSIRFSNESLIHIDFDVDELVLYPNPANDRLYISLRAYHGLPGKIELFSTLGRRLFSKSFDFISAIPELIELDSLVDGVYNLSFTIKGYKPFSRKIVVLRN